MAAITPAYFEFVGPGYLTLVKNSTLVGKAYVQYQNADGAWMRLYDEDKNPVEIGWPAETIPVVVPEGTTWRVAAPYFDCDEPDMMFAFYNADFANPPEVDVPDYNGSPIRCDNKANKGGYTTYHQRFTGPGVLRLVDPGQLASPAWVNVLYQEDPDRSTPYHIDGERAELGTGPESIEIKHDGPMLVGYQVANCFGDGAVVFSMTPVDYSGGANPPDETTFVSAETSTQGHAVFVTLSDANGYASVTAEWEVKINGVVEPIIGVDGQGTNVFTIGFNVFDTIVDGDVVTVSHLVADSGIVQFTDQPVTNTTVTPTPPATASKKKAKKKAKKKKGVKK